MLPLISSREPLCAEGILSLDAGWKRGAAWRKAVECGKLAKKEAAVGKVLREAAFF